MAKTITIKYTAIAAPADQNVADIAPNFYPGNAACDLPVFDGTYYDTNVYGIGEIESLEALVAKFVAHVATPGSASVVAALRKAVKDGTYTFTAENENEALYWGEIAPAVADQGFEITLGE